MQQLKNAYSSKHMKTLSKVDHLETIKLPQWKQRTAVTQNTFSDQNELS